MTSFLSFTRHKYTRQLKHHMLRVNKWKPVTHKITEIKDSRDRCVWPMLQQQNNSIKSLLARIPHDIKCNIHNSLSQQFHSETNLRPKICREYLTILLEMGPSKHHSPTSQVAYLNNQCLFPQHYKP